MQGDGRWRCRAHGAVAFPCRQFEPTSRFEQSSLVSSHLSLLTLAIRTWRGSTAGLDWERACAVHAEILQAYCTACGKYEETGGYCLPHPVGARGGCGVVWHSGREREIKWQALHQQDPRRLHLSSGRTFRGTKIKKIIDSLCPPAGCVSTPGVRRKFGSPSGHYLLYLHERATRPWTNLAMALSKW